MHWKLFCVSFRIHRNESGLLVCNDVFLFSSSSSQLAGYFRPQSLLWMIGLNFGFAVVGNLNEATSGGIPKLDSLAPSSFGMGIHTWVKLSGKQETDWKRKKLMENMTLWSKRAYILISDPVLFYFEGVWESVIGKQPASRFVRKRYWQTISIQFAA